MKKASVTANTILCAKMEIEIKYFNKRKMDFEPFLEPWILHVKFTKINEDTSIYIKNFESKQDKKEIDYIKTNKNCLNINISGAFIETVLEVSKVYSNKIDDSEPFKIHNSTGYSIEAR